MSFYVYYGKLDNELLVAVLPNGTVEHNDPIYLYTKKWNLKSYKATDVKVTDESEDLINFKDTAYAFQIVTKKAYKELTLSITGEDKKTSKVSLTRHYDQPLAAIPLSDPPKIWTGAIDFHSWAKNEAFFIITPKGLGNGKPVVSIWQWTQDAAKTERSLTYSTSQQESQAATPNVFSYKHNSYYTLDCKVNTKTNGLNVTIKEKTNSDAVQKELELAAKITVGAEHQFSPPRPTLEKITLECSFPQATSSLKRYTGQLPFPVDLVETLRHSAAYVDQAGYLAKHAVNQYNQLDKSFLMLEKKAEARAAKIAKLEADVAKCLEENSVLDAKNKELLRQIAENRAAAEAREAKLRADLQKTKEELAASEDKRAKAEAGRDAAESEVKRQKDTIKELKDAIEKDKLEDQKRDKDFKEHDEKDHEKIIDLKKDLAKSREAEAAAAQKIKERDTTIKERDATIVRRDATIKELNARIARRDATIACLEADLSERNHEIVGLRASLKATKEQLAEKTKKVVDLTAELKLATDAKKKLEKDLKDEEYNHGKAKDNLKTAQQDLKDKDDELTLKKRELKSAQDKSDRAEKSLETARSERDAAIKAKADEEKKAAEAETTHQQEQEAKDKIIEKKDAKIKDLSGKLATADREHSEHHNRGGIITHSVKDNVNITSTEIVNA